MSDKKDKYRWYKFGRFLCAVFCRSFFRMRFLGIENVPLDGPVVLISNHQSFLDPMLCGIRVKRQIHFMARDTLYTNPIFGRMIRSVGTVPLKRGEADLGAMRNVIGKLKEGRCVCLFPEGTRSPDGKITRFKPGFGLLCRRGKATVVPVVVEGARECWPREKKLFSPWKKVVLSYGKPLGPDEIKAMDDKTLADSLTDTIRQMQNECRKEMGREPFDYSQPGTVNADDTKDLS